MGPDFLIIGAMKSATSTVTAFLEDHPETFVPPYFEPEFFARDDVWALGQDWYEAHFEDKQGARLCGENSNMYTNSAVAPHAAERIGSLYPDIKLIYVVREPISRTRSAWYEIRSHSGDTAPPTLDLAVRDRPETYVDCSLYWKQLSAYRAHFPDERIHIAFMEDLKTDPAAFFDGICRFLDIAPPETTPDRGHLNKSSQKKIPSQAYSTLQKNPVVRLGKMLAPKGLKTLVKTRLLSKSPRDLPDFSPEVLAELREIYREDARQLLAHTGKPPDFWPTLTES